VKSDTISGRAFDIAALSYDSDTLANPMMRWLRARSLRALLANFSAGDYVMEIGCGTGEEAVALALRGVRVLATDASEGMVRKTTEKAGAAGLPRGMVGARVLPAQELSALIEEHGTGSFSGAYSSLGALNCAPDLISSAASLAELVRPGGKVVISLLGKYCLWETLWYLAARQPRSAFRRWRGLAWGTAVAGGYTMPVYYWSLHEIIKAFRRDFEIRSVRSLPWALPPTYAGRFIGRHPRIMRLLNRLEERTAGSWPFYALGDHVLLEMTRRIVPNARTPHGD
jgi:SAM-dependent methyltransferase